MTRDEAKATLLEHTASSCTEKFMNDFLDCAAALGILELEEPKSRTSKLFDALHWPEGGVAYQTFFNAMEEAGLTLAEK